MSMRLLQESRKGRVCIQNSCTEKGRWTREHDEKRVLGKECCIQNWKFWEEPEFFGCKKSRIRIYFILFWQLIRESEFFLWQPRRKKRHKLKREKRSRSWKEIKSGIKRSGCHTRSSSSKAPKRKEQREEGSIAYMKGLMWGS